MPQGNAVLGARSLGGAIQIRQPGPSMVNLRAMVLEPVAEDKPTLVYPAPVFQGATYVRGPGLANFVPNLVQTGPTDSARHPGPKSGMMRSSPTRCWSEAVQNRPKLPNPKSAEAEECLRMLGDSVGRVRGPKLAPVGQVRPQKMSRADFGEFDGPGAEPEQQRDSSERRV